MNGVSPEFMGAVQWALATAGQSPDEAVRYMVETVPVYAAPRPDIAQAQAGGCPNCVYLGLWAARWTGYQQSPHGIIWLFEEGIRRMGGRLPQQTLGTLLHEFDHALQRDHVLEALGQHKALAAAAMGYRPAARRCCRG